MKKEIVKIYYIGDEFYGDSGTIMSSIYLENGIRTNWGEVQVALKEGKEIKIRQATDVEMVDAYKQLNMIRNRRQK